MKNYYYWLSLFFGVISFVTMSITSVNAQSPYMLSNKWMFGYYAGLDFPLSGAAPSYLTGNQSYAAEASSSIVDPTGALMMYSPGKELWAPGAGSATLGSIGGSSSTNAAVFVPDPSDATFTRYYFFTANDNTGGANIAGIGYYLVTKTGPSTLVASGRTAVATGAEANESIAAGSDGNGGYWVVAHAMTANIYVWHITAGGVSARATLPVPSGVTGGVNGSIKINTCQNRIGWATNNMVEVYQWNRTTGTLGAQIVSVAGGMGAVSYGFEFSPNGNMAYFSGLNAPVLKQIDLTTSTITTLSSASSNPSSNEIGTLQLGLDGKIYVTNGAWFPGACNIGVINNPNVSGAGCNYNASGFTMPGTPAPNGWPAFTYRGISNIGWLTPNPPVMNTSITACTVDFSHTFQNYFVQNIGVNTPSFSWNFGDASSASGTLTPSHTYAASGTYPVSLSFTDNTCNQTWTVNRNVTVSCPMPVDWLDIDAVYKNGAVDVTWSTAMEVNNDYFEVQRSVDGINFVTIGTVNSKGNSNRIQEYSFTDLSPIAGGSYYRIIQHDIDGKSTNSPNAFVSISSVLVNVSPNPSSSDFELTVSGASSAIVIVTDVLGRVVYQNDLSGSVIITSFGSELPEGTYSLQVITDGNSYTEKIVKK